MKTLHFGSASLYSWGDDFPMGELQSGGDEPAILALGEIIAVYGNTIIHQQAHWNKPMICEFDDDAEWVFVEDE